MQNLLENSSASYPAGAAPGKKAFGVTAGPFKGRKVILVHRKPAPVTETEIILYHADYPFTIWTELESIITDSDDYPFDAEMDSAGNIYIVYTKITSHELIIKKLTFTDGNWAAGTPVTIYDSDESFYPSIIILPSGRVQVSWTRVSGGIHYVNTKYSDDEGVTWGSGPSDAGTALSSGVSEAFSKLVSNASFIYAVYSQGGVKLSYRRQDISTSTWDAEIDIATGTGFDSDFDAAAANDGRLAVIFDNGILRYREYDGDQWSAIISVDENGGEFPQVGLFNNNSYIVYISGFGSNQNRLLYSRRQDQTFTEPKIIDNGKSVFERVFCYNSITADYQDLSEAASNDTSGDVYHANTSSIFLNNGDTLYLSQSDQFHYVKAILSSAGSGGSVNWQYHNGIDWISFTPSSGAYHFTSLDKEILLWDDYASIPSDWQKISIEEQKHFWIRVVVTSAFASGPVGTQLTSISNVQAVVLME